MNKIIFPFLIIFLFGNLLSQPISASEPLVTSLKVTDVKLDKSYGPDREHSCNEIFKGTYDGSKIYLEAHATGGSGYYNHTLTYILSNSYQIVEEKAFYRKSASGDFVKFDFLLPKLREEIPYITQSVLLVTIDSHGNKVKKTLSFTVSRSLVLTPMIGAEANKLNCFERYIPYESVASLLSNGSSNMSDINISQGTEKIWENTRGHEFGVYISPLSSTPLGNLLSFNFNYFKRTAKQVKETVQVSTEYHLSPGDYLQIYTQPTRYVTAYNASLISPCGQTTKIEGAYLFQWWGMSYHVYPVNPFIENRPLPETVGAPATNTCPTEYKSSESEEINFWRMN